MHLLTWVLLEKGPISCEVKGTGDKPRRAGCCILFGSCRPKVAGLSCGSFLSTLCMLLYTGYQVWRLALLVVRSRDVFLLGRWRGFRIQWRARTGIQLIFSQKKVDLKLRRNEQTHQHCFESTNNFPLLLKLQPPPRHQGRCVCLRITPAIPRQVACNANTSRLWSLNSSLNNPSVSTSRSGATAVRTMCYPISLRSTSNFDRIHLQSCRQSGIHHGSLVAG